MKTTQSALFSLAALLLLALADPVQAQFTFTTNNSAITITGYTGSGGAVTIPDTINGWPVTSIGFFAFENSSLSSILISSNVAGIGFGAFAGCANLTAISVATNNSAFSSVAGVLFNQSQSTLIHYPAANAGSSYTVPSSVTQIADYAFDGCANLTSVTMPNSVTSIGGNAFQQCTSLGSVIIPAGVTSIEDDVFEDCVSLTSVTIPSGVTSIGFATFQQCASLASITIPAGVTSLGVAAFDGCANLTSVTIPSGVTSIGAGAFQQCTSLTNVVVLNNVTNLGSYAFAWCPNLTGVNFLGNAPSADATVFEDDSEVTVYYLPDTTGWSATFAGMPTTTWSPPLGALQGTILPAAAVTNGALWRVDDGGWQSSGATVSNLLVGDHTVSFSAATGWSLPASQTIFVHSNQVAKVTGTYVATPFDYTINAATITITGYSGSGGSVTIPNSINGWPVTGIGDYAFYNNTGLTSVTLGTNVTSIGEEAFSDCTQLTAITVAAGNSAYASVGGVLFTKNQTVLIEYPAGRPGASYTIPKGVTNIGDEAFLQCTSLTNIALPSSVTSIGSGAFENCTGLSGLKLPGNVTSLGDFAFEECRSLTSITLGTNVTSIGNYAFYGCASLASVTISAGVTNLGYAVFNYCTRLTAITVAVGNPAYSSLAGVLFNGTQTLLLQYPGGKAGDYTIPDSVASIADNAFAGCSSLTSITIPASVVNLSYPPSGRIIFSSFEGPFNGCTRLGAITVAAGNPAYSSMAGVLFNQDQTTLIQYPEGKAGNSYTVPNTVTNLGNAAFASCSSLAGVFFQGNAPSAGWEVFMGDGNFTVYYPPDATGWSSTFGGAPATAWNPSAGVLQVTLLPLSAVFSGAQWQVDNGAWQNSGTTATNLSLGEHTVNFSTVSGWIPPSSQTVLVGSNEIATATGTYTPIPFDYSINNGTVTIFGYFGPGGAVVIPDTIDGLPVTSIEGLESGRLIPIFYSPPPVTLGVVGSGVSMVGFPITSSPFTNGPITSVTIGSLVTNIVNGAFQNCPKLAAITLSARNPAYSTVAGVLFNKAQTTLIEYPEGKVGSSYTIPNSVTNLADYAFSGCTNLASVTLGNRVTSLGYGAFTSCSSLASMLVPGGNPAYGSVGGVLFSKNLTTLIQYPLGKAGSTYTIPSHVLSIGNSAFQSCTKLTSVTIPNSVTTIGVGAFESCSNLTSITLGKQVRSIGFFAFESTKLASVTIPSSVTEIGPEAFDNCANLKAITVAALNPAYASVAGVLFDKKLTTLLQYPEARAGAAYTIPSRVLNIGSSAFQSCANLASVTIPNSVTNIGDGAFESCTNLASVTIGNHVMNIGPVAFAFTKLASVTIPDSVTEIGEGAFQSCTNLVSAVIGNHVMSIGDFAFSDCTSLTSLIIPGSVTSLGDSAFADCTDLARVYFQGNAPSTNSIGYGGEIFGDDSNATAYYHVGTQGWGSTFGGIPTAVWNVYVRSENTTKPSPLEPPNQGQSDAISWPTRGNHVSVSPGEWAGVRTGSLDPNLLLEVQREASLGARASQFGFTLTGSSNQVVLVEACTDLVNPVWQPVRTNTLTGGSLYFSDPQWTNYPSRFYRVRDLPAP